MTAFATRQRRLGATSCVLSVSGLPCLALAVWGVRAIAVARGEWAIFGFFLGGGAIFVGAPGTALAVARCIVGLRLLRDRPGAVLQAKKVGDVAMAFHLAFWAIVALTLTRVGLGRGDFSLEAVAILLGSLALSGVFVGHALAARDLARDAAATSSRTSSRPPSPPSARSL
jgi:hypothetical protein